MENTILNKSRADKRSFGNLLNDICEPNDVGSDFDNNSITIENNELMDQLIGKTSESVAELNLQLLMWRLLMLWSFVDYILRTNRNKRDANQIADESNSDSP